MNDNHIPLHRKPTDAQLRSRRTVLRIQYLADRLRDDLRDAGFDQVDAVLFLQRFWEDTEEQTGRRYTANCCATYRFTADHLKEIKGYFNGSNDILPAGSLETLFEAYDQSSGNTGSFSSFKDLVESLDVSAYKIDDPPIGIQRAHSALVKAISSIPYSGVLPTAFDKCIESNPFLLFRSTNPISQEVAFEYSPNTSSYTDLHIESATFHVASLEEGKANTLQTAFGNFLNAFMIGDPEMRGFCGIAVPCFEKWKSDGFDGAFLGWLVLKYSENPTELDENRVSSIRLLVNHFAERVMDATLVEAIGEYADACRSSVAPKEPEQAFRSYFPRIEGWTVAKDGDSGSIPLKLFLANANSPISMGIKRKADTLPEAYTPSPPEALIVRSQRLFRALEAFHSAARAEGYKKQAQMLELIERPLRAISDALGSMQSETQELRSILFEPEEALFASHAEISEFFKEGHQLPFEGDLAKKYTIKHSPQALGGAGYDNHQAQVVLSCMIATIFGELRMIQRLPDSSLVVSTTAYMIQQKAKDRGTESLAKDLAWLLTNDESKNLAVFLTEGKDLQCAIQRVKDALFTPFKGFSRKWHPLPFQLLGRSLSAYSGRPSVKCVLMGRVSPTETAEIEWPPSPVTMASVLAFLRDFSRAAAQPGTRYPNALEVSNGKDNATLTLKFSSGIPKGKEGIDIDFLRKSLWVMARRLPPEWRVESSHFGDMTRPFIYLLNKAIGLRDTRETQAEGGWWEAKPCKDNVVLSLIYEEALGNSKAASFEVCIADDMKEVSLIWSKPDTTSTSITS